jgi:hypothetical protein
MGANIDLVGITSSTPPQDTTPPTKPTGIEVRIN